MTAADVDTVVAVLLAADLCECCEAVDGDPGCPVHDPRTAPARLSRARELVAAASREHPTAGGRTALRLALVELEHLTAKENG